MRNEMLVVFLLMFLVIFNPHAYAVDIPDGPPKGGDEDAVPSEFKDAVDIAEYKRAELDCIKRYDGLKREICIKEAWLAFEQSKAGERPVRDYLQEKDLVDRKYVTGLELEQLKKKYYQELWEVNQKYKLPNFDNDIAYCRFEHVENAIRNILSEIGKSYPDSVIVMDLKDPDGYLKGNMKSRKRELNEAERAVADALNEGKKSKDFCVFWDVPISLLESDVLQKCRPSLISDMKQVSEISKRAEIGFERFKDKRRAAIERGETSLRECKDLHPSLQGLETLNPSPYEECARRMLLQEVGANPADSVKNNLRLKIQDLDQRWKRINYLLSLTNQIILQCDWVQLDRIRAEALRTLPPDNCMRNYPNFSRLRQGVYDLDRKRNARLDEIRFFRAKVAKKIQLCEGYLKTPGRGSDWQKTWDQNVVKHYNETRQALDGHIRESHVQGYANCIADLVARANALPMTLVFQKGKSSNVFSKSGDPAAKVQSHNLVNNTRAKKEFFDRCTNMRNRYIEVNCGPKRGYSGCALDPLGCMGYAVDAALPDKSTPNRAQCGKAVLDSYYTCLEKCNSQLVSGTLNTFQIGPCGEKCTKVATEKAKNCDRSHK